jgi:putative radical SAM enzyme (TIGR03279 family)
MRVLEVRAESEAALAGILPGDELVSIDGAPIRDGIDIAYALGTVGDEEASAWDFERGGERFTAALPAERPDSLGFEVAPDTVRTCPNRCFFCFVDQLPPGLRESLYVKDEDYRFSFAFGNYITLSNLSEDDYRRIADQRLSPLYVSVHATDDDVRRGMLGNRRAPAILEALGRLGRAGIDLHTQIVVCPGVNDGAVLESTLADLFSLGRAIRSIALVPVGLTAHRAGLPAVRPVTSEGARALLDAVERWQKRFRDREGRAVLYAADELYLLAGRELPPYEAYDDFPQLENGVGLLRSFEAEFNGRVRELAGRIHRRLRLTLVTAALPAPFLTRLVVPALGSHGIESRVVAVENRLLGPSVTVAGLLAGSDLARAIAEAPEGDLTLIPGEALNEDGLTLDGMTVEAIAEAANREHVVATDDPIGAILDFVEDRATDSEGRVEP